MRGARRGAELLALLVTTLGAVVATASGAEAASGRCKPGTGVTVVVDYGSLGRSTGIGCAPNGGGQTASQSVPAAGFPITYTTGQPFVCRISGLPDASQEPCNNTPPADAYWGLFYNEGKGGGWVYSSQGVASLRVPAGGSIGWRWQNGSGRAEPGQAPNPPAPKSSPSKPPKGGGGSSGSGSTPTPAPTPTASTPTPSAGPAPQAAATGAKADDPKGGAEKSAKKPDDKPDKKADDKAGKKKQGTKEKSAKASPSPESTASAQGGDEVVATTPTSATPSGDDGTDAVLLVAGGAAVVLLGAAAGILAWRRRA